MQSSRFSNIQFEFVRHGEQDWDGDTTKGPVNSGLTEKGRNQAAEAAELLANRHGEKEVLIVASTLQRTLETADIIHRKLPHSKVITEEDLQELYYGDFRKGIKTDTCLPEDAEDKDTFKDRVLRVFIKIGFKHNRSNMHLILVSHAHVFECLSKVLTKKEETIGRGGVVHFEMQDNGLWQLNKLITGFKNELPREEKFSQPSIFGPHVTNNRINPSQIEFAPEKITRYTTDIGKISSTFQISHAMTSQDKPKKSISVIEGSNNISIEDNQTDTVSLSMAVIASDDSIHTTQQEIQPDSNYGNETPQYK